MELVKKKIETFKQALETFDESIELFSKNKAIDQKIVLALQDSMIQRFEYCTDLFWKLLKVYLENIEKISLVSNSPRGIIRDATKAKLITEAKSDQCMTMIDYRNQTSHIYHREVAELIAASIPNFNKLMHAVLNRIEQNLAKF